MAADDIIEGKPSQSFVNFGLQICRHRAAATGNWNRRWRNELMLGWARLVATAIVGFTPVPTGAALIAARAAVPFGATGLATGTAARWSNRFRFQGRWPTPLGSRLSRGFGCRHCGLVRHSHRGSRNRFSPFQCLGGETAQASSLAGAALGSYCRRRRGETRGWILVIGSRINGGRISGHTAAGYRKREVAVCSPGWQQTARTREKNGTWSLLPSVTTPGQTG